MPRPKKAVVDYFPHFVSHKKTMFILEQVYKNNGYAFWFKLLEILGSSEHHFLDCNVLSNWKFLVARTLLEEESVTEILDLLAELEAIDPDLWKIKVIRSENFIQLLETVYSRRRIDVYTKTDVWDLCKQKYKLKGINEDLTTESKGKESKGKERKVKYIYRGKVKLKEEELQKLHNKFGKEEAEQRIEDLDLYIKSKGKRYKDHYSTILAWARKEEKEQASGKFSGKGVPRPSNKFSKEKGS